MKEQDLMVGMSRIILNNLFFFRCVVAVFSAHSLVISGAVHARVQISQSPLHGGGDVPGNLAIVASIEFPTVISVANLADTYTPGGGMSATSIPTSATNTTTVLRKVIVTSIPLLLQGLKPITVVIPQAGCGLGIF